MSDADNAFAAAEAAIETARAEEADSLDLADKKFAALTRLPDSIATLDKLRSLTLGDHRAHVAVTDLTPLAQITGLTTLYLNNTQVTDLAPLAQITGLTTLDLDNTQVTNLAPLAQITGLTRLDLDNTQVADLTPLAQIAGLTTLFLVNTQVTDLSPLAQITGLTRLSLANTQVTDLSPLAQITGLTRLSLDNTQVADLTPLAQIAGLTSLYLDNTQVTDLRPIRGLRALAETPEFDGLTFKGCAATQIDTRVAEIAEIEDAKERAATLFAYLEYGVPRGEGELPHPDALFPVTSSAGRLEVAASVPTEGERDEALRRALHSQLVACDFLVSI